MKLKAQVRESQGRRSCQKIRKQGFYPAVVYGKKMPSSTVQVDQRVWDSFMKSHAVRSQPFELELGPQTYDVLVKEIKRSTSTQKIEHLDFYTIERNKPIIVNVALRYINQEESVGLKNGGMLNQQMHEIEISALPKHIPSSIEVDIIELEMGVTLHLSDVVLPNGCSLTKPIEDAHNPPIVSISEPREEEADPEVEEISEEGEISEGEEAGSGPTDEAPSAEAENSEES